MKGLKRFFSPITDPAEDGNINTVMLWCLSINLIHSWISWYRTTNFNLFRWYSVIKRNALDIVTHILLLNWFIGWVEKTGIARLVKLFIIQSIFSSKQRKFKSRYLQIRETFIIFVVIHKSKYELKLYI